MQEGVAQLRLDVWSGRYSSRLYWVQEADMFGDGYTLRYLEYVVVQQGQKLKGPLNVLCPI